VLRTINMNYGKRSRTGPKGIVQGIARSSTCTKAHAGYGSWRRPRRVEYISACIFASGESQVSLSVSLRAGRFETGSWAAIVSVQSLESEYYWKNGHLSILWKANWNANQILKKI